MWSVEFFGAALQGYGPPAIVVLLWLRHHPELQMIALFSTLIGLLAYFPSAFVYLGAATTTESGGTAMSSRSIVGTVILSALFKDCLRLATCRLVVAMDGVFRKRRQVLHASRFRLLSTGASVGFGIGCAWVLLRFGTSLEAFNHLITEGTLSYDLDVCPQLPMLYFQALQGNLVFFFDIVVTALMLPAVAAISQPADAARHGRSSFDHSLTPTSETSLLANDQLATNVSASFDTQATVKVRSKKKSPEAIRRAEQRAKSSILGSGFSENDPPRAMTTLKGGDGIGVIVVLILLHTGFCALSLLNQGATDFATATHIGTRGCIISLPLQAVVLLLPWLMLRAVAKVEVISRNLSAMEDYNLRSIMNRRVEAEEASSIPTTTPSSSARLPTDI